MITFKEYAEQFAKEKGFNNYETLFMSGLYGAYIEEFTKGYAKLVAEAQKASCTNSYLKYVGTDEFEEEAISIINAPLIELI